jgi:hypothetical protein
MHRDRAVAGTLEITEEHCWMPPGWIYDNVMERVAAAVEPDHPALAAELLNARIEGGTGGYLDARCWEHARLSRFADAVELVHAQYDHDGASAFADPEFYPGFMIRLVELREMLRSAVATPSRRPDTASP